MTIFMNRNPVERDGWSFSCCLPSHGNSTPVDEPDPEPIGTTTVANRLAVYYFSFRREQLTIMSRFGAVLDLTVMTFMIGVPGKIMTVSPSLTRVERENS
jgi:hypothetical protein